MSTMSATAALSAYNAALASPSPDWASVAGLLFKAMPKPRKSRTTKRGRWPMVLVDVGGWQMVTSTPWKGDAPDLAYAERFVLGWYERKCLRAPGMAPVVVKVWEDAGDYWDTSHDALYGQIELGNVRFEASPEAIADNERERVRLAHERRLAEDRAITIACVLDPEFVAEGKRWSAWKRFELAMREAEIMNDEWDAEHVTEEAA